MIERLRHLLPPAVLLATGLAVWQAWTMIAHVPDFLLPSPAAIWRTSLAERDLLLTNAVPTLEVAILGFLLALALGVLSAVAIRYSRILELSLLPVLITSQTVPIIALAPILVVLLGFNILPKLIIVCLICFFPIVINTVDGFKSVDPDLVNLMRTLGARRMRTFRTIEFPSALPFVFSGAKLAVTYCVVGAIFGEWAGSSQGLGWLMIQKAAEFDTEALFGAMALLTLMGIGLFTLVSLTERLLMPWHRVDSNRHALARVDQ